MVQAFSLRDVRFYEVSARLLEISSLDGDQESSGNTNADPEPEPARDVDEDSDVDVDWNLMVRHLGTEFGVRIEVQVKGEFGEIVVDVAAEYESEGPHVLSRSTVEEYVNHVALMHLFPYIRETVAEMARKVARVSLLLPVFERGQLMLQLGPGPDISYP